MNLRDSLCDKLSIAQVPVIARGHFFFEELVSLLSTSALTDQATEDIYLRWDSGDWLVRRAKVVHPKFLRSLNAHWSRRGIEANSLQLN